MRSRALGAEGTVRMAASETGGVARPGALARSGNSSDGEIGIENPVGAHLVVSMPMGGGVYIMGKAGYVSATISREYLGVDYEDLDISGAAFGVGAGFRSGPWDFRMEYAFMSGGDSGDGGVLGMFALHHF